MAHIKASFRTEARGEPGTADGDSGRATENSLLSRLGLIGESPVFRSALALLLRMATCDATVLIEGETGTGKESAARALHYLGPRRAAAFVPINCGAIPDALVESELFGHVRGAFTDARESHAGVVAQAEGGTLFLDEVEAMAARAQVALLRFLQDRVYRPVGGTPRGADVRVIAASNADLHKLAEAGVFRRDLLFRLDILRVELPPLRARADDVLLLAEAFAARLCRQYGKPVRKLHASALAVLRAHPWPGNVRELENLIHRAVVLDDGEWIRLPDELAHPTAVGGSSMPLPDARLTDRPFRAAKASAIASFERAYLAELLARTDGNISEAARLAGKERSRLGKLARKHGLARSAPATDQQA